MYSGAEDDVSRSRVAAMAVFLLLLAGGLVVWAVILGVNGFTNRGPIGAAARNYHGGRFSPGAGFWTLLIGFLAVATFLVLAAFRALRNGHLAVSVVLPFALLLVFGTVGEIADLLGTASGLSDLIGALILVGAAIPVVLMWPAVRQWLSQHWRPPIGG